MECFVLYLPGAAWFEGLSCAGSVACFMPPRHHKRHDGNPRLMTDWGHGVNRLQSGKLFGGERDCRNILIG